MAGIENALKYQIGQQPSALDLREAALLQRTAHPDKQNITDAEERCRTVNWIPPSEKAIRTRDPYRIFEREQ